MPKHRVPSEDRPPLWAEGRQHPPLQPRAFALASVRLARDSLARLLERCAAASHAFGMEVATGRWRVPAHRLGRSGHLLPSVATTARTIRATAGVLGRAARVALPAPVDAAGPASIFSLPPREPFTPVPVAERAPAPAATPAAPRPAAEDDLALLAIRAMMAEPPAAPTLPAADRLAPSPAEATPPDPEAGGWWRERAADAAAGVLAYGLLVVAVPWGAGRAVLAHLNGEDLRDLAEAD